MEQVEQVEQDQQVQEEQEEEEFQNQEFISLDELQKAGINGVRADS